MDCLSPRQRSAMMARVKNKNTRPEMVVRKTLWALGYRYRLHARELPGRPDIVFYGRRKIVFVHGCFWHSHANCKKASIPTTRREFWEAKLADTVQRDRRAITELRQQGWHALIIWECQTKGAHDLAGRLKDFVETRA